MSAALCGIIGAILGITGTPMLAGFGFTGLVGPLAYFELEGWSLLNIGKAIIAFVVAPVAFGIIFNRVFTKIVPIIDPEDYRLNFS
ncbi:PTS sugar transporter subunit IIC [Bowdeniella nasicola]|nr:PTS sugar transporter subunit IIC [Bowdeniella nasicola]